MMTLILTGLMLWVAFGMIDIAIRLSWGIIKAFFAILIMPGLLVGLVVLGLIKIGLPLLIISGVLMVFRRLLY